MKVIHGSYAPAVPFACCDIVDASLFGDADALQTAIAGGDATPIPEGTEIPPDAVAWLVGDEESSSLQTMFALEKVAITVSHAYYAILIGKTDSNIHREKMAKTMRKLATDALQGKYWNSFMNYADLACCLALIPTPADVGTLAAAHMLANDEPRAHFYLRTAHNTWGTEFFTQALSEYERVLCLAMGGKP